MVFLDFAQNFFNMIETRIQMQLAAQQEKLGAGDIGRLFELVLIK